MTFVIGPKCCGKTALSLKLAELTNMKYMNFANIMKVNKLK